MAERDSGYLSPVSEQQPQISPPSADPLLAPLNESQQAAVSSGDGPLLVLAGAGSGKTKVITHRVAWLVERRQVAPWNILAVTFTNKAAGEMRERLVKLLGPAAGEVAVSTFHSAGASILRREAEKVGLSRSFVIYDDADQTQLLRRALSDLGLTDRLKVQLVRHRIDQAKNHAKRPEDLNYAPHDPQSQAVKKVYALYERLLRAADAVDFGDLLLKVVWLFKRDPDTLERFRRRFRYVLVDEFQDTNPVQYELLRLLCPKGRSNLCVVGDDDQSIYRWRGADISNILSFEQDFPGAQVVKLERNYRSDAGILDAAYAVIRKNARRKEKRLWTDRPRGEPLELIYAPDERSEAQLIAARVKSLASQGNSLAQMAVFYRVNAQSRVLEEGLRLASVPYHVVRGRAFYDRAEIKDAASYLRLAVNPKSDADLARVINVPARGIGDTTVERLQAHAQQREVSLFEALAEVDQIGTLNAAAQRRLKSFRELVVKLGEKAKAGPDAHTAVSAMLELSGLLDSHVAEGTDEGQERAENLREFLGAAAEFDRLRAEELHPSAGEEAPRPADEPGPLKPPQAPLDAFLEQISLVGDADSEGDGGRVSLMTLHAAKGLEFDVVFLTGMEEGVFPHSRATEGDAFGGADPEEMAEERRLCYVGITRARRRLFFTLSRSRALFGNLQFNEPSRFLKDVPQELFQFGAALAPQASEEEIEPGELRVVREPELQLDDADGFVSHDEFDQRSEHERYERRPAIKPAVRRASGPAPAVGARVRHQQLGEGLVVDSSGGPDPTVTVRFPGAGERRIKARFLSPAD